QSLLHRVLVGTTHPGDVVLDPFFGTGTTGAVAKMLGRDWIGIEREDDYIAAATARLSRIRRLDAEALQTTTPRRAEPRVPFGQVVERGMLNPGEVLFSSNSRHRARVRADGSLIGDDVKGSIHQVGAALEGAPSCNGWTYWHFKREGRMLPIDALRQQIRAEMAQTAARHAWNSFRRVPARRSGAGTTLSRHDRGFRPWRDFSLPELADRRPEHGVDARRAGGQHHQPVET